MKKSDVLKTVVCVNNRDIPPNGMALELGKKYRYWTRNIDHVFLIIDNKKTTFGYSADRFK